MRGSRFSLALLAVLLAACSSTRAEDPAPVPSTPSDKAPTETEWTGEKLADLVKRLGDERFVVRDEASNELAKAPVSLLPELLKHAQGSDPECRKRLQDAARDLFMRKIIHELGEWKIGRGFLGISWNISDDPPGVLVQQVLPGTGAEKAGVESGDIITKIDKKKCEAGFTHEEAVNIWRQMSPGDPMKLEIKHGENIKEIDATVGEKPEEYRDPDSDSDKADTIWAKFLSGELKLPERMLRQNGKSTAASARKPLQSWLAPEEVEKSVTPKAEPSK